ncbi:hypothetical protein ACNOYE_13185 [Nannocystaceae bacterium ST9]
MGRRRREHVSCPTCAWQGVTRLGRVRLGVFALAWAGVLGLFVAAWLGATSFDQAIALAITGTLLSIGLRLAIRGDRCPTCGERLT